MSTTKKEDLTGRLVNKRRLAKVQDYQKTFQSDHGRRVLYDLIDAHGVMATNFHENPNVLAAREGERGVVLRILAILKTDNEQLRKLIEEAHEHISSKSII